MKPDGSVVKPNYWDRAKRALARRDAVMARIMRAHPKIFLARRGEPFLTLARAIVGQQISVKAAQSVWDRFVACVGDLTPQTELAKDRSVLTACGLSDRKTEDIPDPAQPFSYGSSPVPPWAQMSDPVTDRGMHSGVLRRDEGVRTGSLLMAAGTALLVCLALLVCAFLDLLPWQVAIEGTAGVATLVMVFYLIVRTGLNLRFRDPSLATEQTAAAILFLAYIMYHAGQAREALTLFYLVVMLFGALRLSAARLAGLSGLALVAHGTMLHLSYLRDQDYMDVE